MRIVILGSTGSIGRQVLECVRVARESFSVVGLTCNTAQDIFKEQIHEWQPVYTVIASEEVDAEKALKELVERRDVDVVVNAISGAAGVEPTRAAVRAGKIVLLANKESLVLTGEEIMSAAQKSGAQIIPLDSEAAGLWQLLRCEDYHAAHRAPASSTAYRAAHRAPASGTAYHPAQSVVPGLCPDKFPDITRFTITASGGPFFGCTAKELSHVTREQALNHPTWKMGKKITIDSATLMNKAFELIECHTLFAIPIEKLHVVVDRKSQAHAGVERSDGTAEWVMYDPDMRCCIADALFYLSADVSLGQYLNQVIRSGVNNAGLHFDAVDEKVFPALAKAREAIMRGQEACTALCMANEKAVHAFLNGTISFSELLYTS